MANAVNATIDGVGQLTYGLAWWPDTGASISGLGLETIGFLWLKNDIWVDCDACVEATWTECDCNDQCG